MELKENKSLSQWLSAEFGVNKLANTDKENGNICISLKLILFCNDYRFYITEGLDSEKVWGKKPTLRNLLHLFHLN